MGRVIHRQKHQSVNGCPSQCQVCLDFQFCQRAREERDILRNTRTAVGWRAKDRTRWPSEASGRGANARTGAMRDRTKAGAEARGGQKGKEEQEEIRHANNQHFPLSLSQLKHAQTVMAITLLVLCTIGSLLLDQTSLIGNRILMPVLTVSQRAVPFPVFVFLFCLFCLY